MSAFDKSQFLPIDVDDALLIGRVSENPVTGAAPKPVRVTKEIVYDLSALALTCSELMKLDKLVERIQEFSDAPIIGETSVLIENSLSRKGPAFISPVDLQTVKACGVTFARSMLERVIEERAGGDPAKADQIRSGLADTVGADISEILPGSEEAAQLKEALIRQGIWSQYLEVGIGPDAEVFTKAPVLSSVGLGAEIGIHPMSSWNNPEPEAVLIVSPTGTIQGATLGNDVNLRDVEGRSALLLGKAKDNNASAAIGPFIRLFDDKFTMANLEQETIHLTVSGDDGFMLDDFSSMSEISRSPADLAAQTLSRNHQYPDGVALYTGTMFAPTKDRGEPGSGFTHQLGDMVSISSERLGKLTNQVTHSDKAPEWKYGIFDLFKDLAKSGYN